MEFGFWGVPTCFVLVYSVEQFRMLDSALITSTSVCVATQLKCLTHFHNLCKRLRIGSLETEAPRHGNTATTTP